MEARLVMITGVKMASQSIVLEYEEEIPPDSVALKSVSYMECKI